MRKIMMSLSLSFAVILTAGAQMAKGDFLQESVVGQTFESVAFNSSKDGPVLERWIGYWIDSPTKNALPPIAGQPLSWTGYGERGNSIVMGSGFPNGVKGRRGTSYVFSRPISTGVMYLSFIIKPELIANRKYWPQAGFCTSMRGGGPHCCVCFFPESGDGLSYNIGVRLVANLMIVDTIYSVGQKHLIVMKYDLDKHVVSVFIDPDLSRPEPLPDESVKYVSSSEKVCGITYRDASETAGLIGNFRVARTWEDIR